MSQYTLTINLEVIKNNYKTLQKICATSEVGASVKANCYGIGMKQVAPAFADLGCRHFFVTNKEEGMFLRESLNKHVSDGNFPNIYVLNGYFPGDKNDFIKSNLIPVLNTLHQVELWKDFTHKLNKNSPCLLHIDTGLNRFAIPESEVKLLPEYITNMNVLCIMSHLSSSENPNNKSNIQQLTKFQELSVLFPNIKKSLANSSGIFLGKEYHFDITRPGAALYGINPTPYKSKNIIKNPIHLTAPIIQIKEINDGESVGYNETYLVKQKPRLVATLLIGYADGYMHSLSNKGVVFINDRPAPVIGRVSMDLITIDVSNIPQEKLFLGQEAEIIGDNMNLDQFANLAGTTSYEILTMLGNRYTRIYI